MSLDDTREQSTHCVMLVTCYVYVNLIFTNESLDIGIFICCALLLEVTYFKSLLREALRTLKVNLAYFCPTKR